MMSEILADGVMAGLQGVESYESSRTITLYQNDNTIKAEITITLDLKVSAP